MPTIECSVALTVSMVNSASVTSRLLAFMAGGGVSVGDSVGTTVETRVDGRCMTEGDGITITVRKEVCMYVITLFLYF